MCGPAVANIFDPLNIAGKTRDPIFDIRDPFGLKGDREESQALQLPPLPKIPEPSIIKDQAKEEAKRRAARRTPTILTGGAGLIDDPNLNQKRKLGG